MMLLALASRHALFGQLRVHYGWTCRWRNWSFQF